VLHHLAGSTLGGGKQKTAGVNRRLGRRRKEGKDWRRGYQREGREKSRWKMKEIRRWGESRDS
jgi:hypothetical protein